MKLNDLKPGDTVILDDRFTCMAEGAHVVKAKDDTGLLFLDCEEGTHYLDGQENEDGELVGISKRRRSA